MIKAIDLRGRVADAATVSFLRVEWRDDRSPFVLVRYAEAGSEQALGLRIDMDKKIFLDHLDDPAVDALVQHSLPAIWIIVANERFTHDYPRL